MSSPSRTGVLSVTGNRGVIKGAVSNHRAGVVIEIHGLEEKIFERTVLHIGVSRSVGVGVADGGVCGPRPVKPLGFEAYAAVVLPVGIKSAIPDDAAVG